MLLVWVATVLIMDLNSTLITVSGLTLLRPLTVFFIKKFHKSVEILTLFLLKNLDLVEKIKKIKKNKITILKKRKSKNYICVGISGLYKICLTIKENIKWYKRL